MGKKIAVSILLALSGILVANAQQHDPSMHQQHMAALAEDSRQLVNFPPEMQAFNLMNMRGHLAALSEILAALSDTQYAKAAAIADAKLGLNSPSAEGCKSGGDTGAPQMSTPPSMDQQMSTLMPEGMRDIGLAMHTAASAFAVEARKIGHSGSPKPAIAALSRVTQQCVACHSVYRVR